MDAAVEGPHLARDIAQQGQRAGQTDDCAQRQAPAVRQRAGNLHGQPLFTDWPAITSFPAGMPLVPEAGPPEAEAEAIWPGSDIMPSSAPVSGSTVGFDCWR